MVAPGDETKRDGRSKRLQEGKVAERVHCCHELGGGVEGGWEVGVGEGWDVGRTWDPSKTDQAEGPRNRLPCVTGLFS